MDGPRGACKTTALSSTGSIPPGASYSLSCLFPVSISPHFRTFKQNSRSSILAFTHRVMGIHYQTAPRSVSLQALPRAMRAAVQAAWVHSQHRDRGNVHRKNDRTVNSRATHFASWLGTVSYDDQTVRMIRPSKASMLLEGYLHAIMMDKEACLHSNKSTLQGSTLLLYLKATALWFHTELGLTIPIVCPTSQNILPPFCDPIAQAFQWGSPQDKWEPYTHQMLCTFHHQA